MNIKSTIQPAPEAAITFPCLMIGRGVLVLFSGPGVGTTLNHSAGYSIGCFAQSWDMSCFEPFTGAVTLSSEPAEEFVEANDFFDGADADDAALIKTIEGAMGLPPGSVRAVRL